MTQRVRARLEGSAEDSPSSSGQRDPSHEVSSTRPIASAARQFAVPAARQDLECRLTPNRASLSHVSIASPNSALSSHVSIATPNSAWSSHVSTEYGSPWTGDVAHRTLHPPMTQRVRARLEGSAEDLLSSSGQRDPGREVSSTRPIASAARQFAVPAAHLDLECRRDGYFGLFEIANGLIYHREGMRVAGRNPSTTADYLATLHNELLQLQAGNFELAENMLDSVPRRQKRHRSDGTSCSHTMLQNQTWYGPAEKQRRRQRACKVCCLLRAEKPRSGQTTYYCQECSLDSDRLLLTCSRVRGHSVGPTKTCWQIWHEDFDCGNAIPASMKHRLQYRKSRSSIGVRKMTSRELYLEEKRANDLRFLRQQDSCVSSGRVGYDSLEQEEKSD